LPHSVLEGRSKKAGLGSSSNPQNCPLILKQKRESQPFGHLKWPGVGPNELIGGSGGSLKAAFWLITFSRVQFHCPTFLPLHFFANPQLPPKNRSSVRNAGKVVRSTAKATPGAGWFLAETGLRRLELHFFQIILGPYFYPVLVFFTRLSPVWMEVPI
jgi:hypothetical protein